MLVLVALSLTLMLMMLLTTDTKFLIFPSPLSISPNTVYFQVNVGTAKKPSRLKSLTMHRKEL
jgi:hypothetical protein